MGQKIHPIGLRLGIIKPWLGCWYAPKGKYQQYLHEDIKLRQFVKTYLSHASVSKVEIERYPQRVRIIIHTAKPGIVIGRKGGDVNALRKKLQSMTSNEIDISIHEIKNPLADAQLVAEGVGQQLLKRVAFRRAIRKSISDARRAGVQGIKIHVSGRLGGAEIARSEWLRDGRVPLHTLRADIDYGFTHVFTTYGALGVKVWIFTKEILPKGKELVSGRVQESAKSFDFVPISEEK
ncbi:MAG: 30S ribosomal protein S3 [Candidatus Hydrogenedentes bacterium CG1_02_42_14]|nr:MAG: 30S ribosomal protein S3 [Candidatus Hydrogenedentes bacterium CG1_02_42_14]